jgi:hypothetical protein
MIIAGIFSFNDGQQIIQDHYSAELREIEEVIAAVNSSEHRTKVSKEKTMPGKMLFKPGSLNSSFRAEFESRHWHKYRVFCDYRTDYYTPGYVNQTSPRGAFREMDFIKKRMGVEVQFGKYAFMVYNVCAKMTIFHRLDLIDVGVEIVPVKSFADHMSTGVSYFEQFVWDLEHRGVSNLDIPVLILGIAASPDQQLQDKSLSE